MISEIILILEIKIIKKRVIYHFLFWLLYLAYSTYLVASYDWDFYRAFMGEIIELPIKVAVTYFLMYFVLPRYFETKKYPSLIFIALITVVATALIHRVLIYAVVQPWYWPDSTIYFWNFSKMAGSVFSIFSIAGIAIALKLYRQRFDGIKREQELEKEKLKAELGFLRSQINPHFLFNTLNNIYGLSLKNSTRTPEAILKLSALLRFILKGGNSERLSVEHEVKVIEDYIDLERLRYGERLDLKFEKDIDSPSQQIAPLLLLSFVENSFKHGASESRFSSEIQIALKLQNGLLDFKIANSMEKNEATENNGGVGLGNIKRQLELVYGSCHQLKIESTINRFSVHLSIDLNKCKD